MIASENDELDESIFGKKSGIELSTSDIVKRAKKLASRSRIQSPTSDITKRVKKNLMANRSTLSTIQARTGTSSSKQEGPGTVSLSVCLMEKNLKKDLHKKSGGYFEVMANRSDSYETLVNRLKLKFPSVSTKKELSLFRSNGARIVNEKLVVRGAEKPWRLGTYLHFLHVSPEVLRLGIGYDSRSSEDSNSDDEISTAGHGLLDHASIDKQTRKSLSRSSGNPQQLNNAANQFGVEFIDLENELNPKRAKVGLESDLQLYTSRCQTT